MDTVVELSDGGANKKFIVKKMGAYQAEAWLYRAALAIGRNVPDIIGMFKGDRAVLVKSLLSVDYEQARPLLDELLACCSLVNGEAKVQMGRDASAYIADPTTLMKLRIEAAKANFGFFMDGVLSNFRTNSDTEQSAQK